MNGSERVQVWTRRKANGKLAYPMCVRAHLEEINSHNPDLLTEEDLRQIGMAQTHHAT